MDEKAWKKLAMYVITLRSSGRLESHKSATSKSCWIDGSLVGCCQSSVLIWFKNAQVYRGARQLHRMLVEYFHGGRSTSLRKLTCAGAKQASPYWVYHNLGDRVYGNVSMRIWEWNGVFSIKYASWMIQEITNSARPSDQLDEKSRTSTSLYGAVLRWHQRRRPSFADRPSSLWDHDKTSQRQSWVGTRITDLMPAMVKRRMRVHIMPSMSLRFPSIMSTQEKIRHDENENGEMHGCGVIHTFWPNVS